MTIKHEIEEKLKQLKSLDKRYSIFGSSHHRYILNSPLSVKEISFAEEEYEVSFPSDYKDFISRIGNGGAGKSYGMSMFGIRDYYRVNEAFKGVDYLLKKHISNWWEEDRKFLLKHNKSKLEQIFKEKLDNIDTYALFMKATEENLDLKEYYYYNIFYEDKDFKNPLIDYKNVYIEIPQKEFKGYIPLFEEGCGHQYVLIVAGQNYGEVVFFGNDGQLAGTEKSFIEFYLHWVDECISELTRIQKNLKIMPFEKMLKFKEEYKTRSIHSKVYSILDSEMPELKVNTPEYNKATQELINRRIKNSIN